MQRLYSKPLPNTNTINLSIVGMNGSGKSAVVVKYLTRRFIVEYAPYLNDSYVKTDLIDGQEFTLNIQDTSDSDEIDLVDINKWSQAIIILFSMTSRRSFYRAQELIEALKQVSEQHIDRKSMGSNLFPQRPASSGSNLTSLSSSTLSTYASGPGSSMSIQLSPGPVSSLRRAALYTITPVKPPTMILVANKLDLERFRLVEKREAETFAKVHGIPYYEITVTQTYKEIQAIFHAAARLCIQPKPGKTRGQNGSLTSPGRGILPGVGSGSSPNSVLSSLAVSPGLLLQKKTSPLSVPDNPNTMEIEQTPANGSSSILSNLRLRATSPPTTVAGLRSTSPGPNANSQIPPKNPAGTKTAQPAAASASASPPNTNQPTGSSNSIAVTTRIPSPNSEHINVPVHNPQRRTTLSSQGSIKNLTVPPAPPAPPVQPKKSIGFKFFSKRTK